MPNGIPDEWWRPIDGPRDPESGHYLNLSDELEASRDQQRDLEGSDQPHASQAALDELRRKLCGDPPPDFVPLDENIYRTIYGYRYKLVVRETHDGVRLGFELCKEL